MKSEETIKALNRRDQSSELLLTRYACLKYTNQQVKWLWKRVCTYLLMKRKDHMWETCKLEKHKENELTREMLPEELAVPHRQTVSDRLHGINHQIHQLVLQQGSCLCCRAEIKYSIPKASQLVSRSYQLMGIHCNKEAKKHGMKLNLES